MSENLTSTISEMEGVNFKEAVGPFEISDEQAEDSECGGDSDAEDIFPLGSSSKKNVETYHSRKKRKMVSYKKKPVPEDAVIEEVQDLSTTGQSSNQINNPVPDVSGTERRSSSDTESTSSDSNEEEEVEEMAVEELVVSPGIPIEIAVDESLSEESSEEMDGEAPKWKKDAMGNSIKKKFDNHHFDRPFGPKTVINTDSVLSIFSIFFTNDLLNNIIEQSNLYAMQNGHSLNLSQEELRCFLGILIIMGFHQLPSMRLYWSTERNFTVSRISRLMSMKRFLAILRYFHLNDNSLMPARGTAEYDKLYKIRPFLDHFLEVFKNAFSPSRYLTIDESVIAFKGGYSLKKYMPIKQGLKIWAICCSVTGYLLAFDFYSGKTEDRTTSLGEKIVLQLSRGFEGFGYCLFFGEFFSSFSLMKKILKKGFYACAMILPTRKYFPSSFLAADGDLKFGEADSCHCDEFGLVKWKNRGTKCVCVVSSMDDPQKTAIVNRRKETEADIPVNCPESIHTYNKYMGGVDVFDQYMASHTTHWKSRRWWIKIFYYFLDASIVNSYILYKEEIKNLSRKQKAESKKPLNHLTFRNKLAEELIGNFTRRKASPKPVVIAKKKFARPSLSIPPLAHLPTKCKQRRCAMCSTKKQRKRTTIQCDTCQVGLCLNTCFKKYHDAMKFLSR